MTEPNNVRHNSRGGVSLWPTPVSARSRRRLSIVSFSVFAFLSLTAAGTWLGITATTISNHLAAAENLVPRLKGDIIRDDSAAATLALDELRSHTGVARQAASDPLWTIAGTLPWIGPNIQAITTVATSADDVATLGAGPLVNAFQSLDWESLAPSGKGVDLAPLVAAQPRLMSSAHAVNQSAERLNSLDADSLLPQVSAPLIKARDQLNSLRGDLDAAADAATIAPNMMGATTPRRYLLLIQNNAESRATGGIPGALAVLEVDKGKLTLTAQTSATELGVMSPAIEVEPEQQQIYSGRMGKFMQDVNLSPDFPSSASTAVAMWKQKTGTALDGVISIDPVALSYLLDGTGPVRLEGTELEQLIRNGLPSELTTKNVVKTLLSDVYADVPEPAMQDLYFAGVAKEIFEALSAGKNDNRKLIAGATKGVDEGRILLWSAVPREQSVISDYAIGGSIAGKNISPAQFGVYFNDGTGAKMDYYVKRTAQLIQDCTTDGYVKLKVRVTSTNLAPADAATSLPTYVTGGAAFGIPEGTVQTNIVAYGPVQSNIEETFLAGKKTAFASQRHQGRPVGALTVRLAPGETSVVEFSFGKIVQHSEPRLAVTPTIQTREEVVLDTVQGNCVPAS